MKKLVLLRHAHRDKIPSESDNGLSKKGHKQAEDTAAFLAKRWKKEWDKADLEIYSSPLVRCVETAEYLGKALDLQVVEEPLLAEADHRESVSEYISRVSGFISRWKKSKTPITVACSHGDWIPEAARQLLSADIDIRKGAFLEIDEVRDRDGAKIYELTYQREPSE